MTCYLFLVLLLLLLMSCALSGVNSAGTAELFKKEEYISALTPEGTENKKQFVLSVLYPSFVLVNGVMFGQVKAEVDNEKINILTKYIGTEGERWAERAIEDDGKNWRAQWALESEIKNSAVSVPVAKEDTIYILHASNAEESTSKNQWDFLLSAGKVTHSDDGEISIVWRKKKLDERLTKDIQAKLESVNLIYGSGFVMEDGTFVFVFTGERTDSKRVFTVAHSKDPSSDLTFYFDDKTAPNCFHNYFPWGEKLLIFPIDCTGQTSDYKLQESNDMGKTWKVSSGKLAEKLKGKSLTDSYTTITIGKRRLLLFPEPQKQDRSYDINLFVADDDHVKPLGLIFTSGKHFTFGSFLYTNDELFYLGVQYDRDNKIFLFRLKDQLEEIKKHLKTWYPDDAKYENAGENARSESSVHLHVSVAVMLLCVLFGMWAPIAF